MACNCLSLFSPLSNYLFCSLSSPYLSFLPQGRIDRSCWDFRNRYPNSWESLGEGALLPRTQRKDFLEGRSPIQALDLSAYLTPIRKFGCSGFHDPFRDRVEGASSNQSGAVLASRNNHDRVWLPLGQRKVFQKTRSTIATRR